MMTFYRIWLHKTRISDLATKSWFANSTVLKSTQNSASGSILKPFDLKNIIKSDLAPGLHVLGTRTKFQLEILIKSTVSGVHKFQELEKR